MSTGPTAKFANYPQESQSPAVSPMPGADTLRLTHVWMTLDMGRRVAPDIGHAQAQSGVVFGLTAALFGQITLKDGTAEQRNFNDYRMLLLHETPAIDVRFIDSDAAPSGIGEPGVPLK